MTQEDRNTIYQMREDVVLMINTLVIQRAELDRIIDNDRRARGVFEAAELDINARLMLNEITKTFA